MIDDAFLRHVAALQANLKMLESQSDALSDLADMKELRLYKSRLTEYIQAHTKAGNLPEDPFHVIAQRLEPISKFFTEAKETCKRLTVWKADWLKSVPAVSLSDLQVAKTELSEIVDSNPQIQEYLRGYLSSIDWDTSSDKVDLHPELLACAQCLSSLSLPHKAKDRLGLYQFAHNEGQLAEKIASHFEALRSRIEELINIHELHENHLVEIDRHLEKHDFRSAEHIWVRMRDGRFSDINYAPLESRQHTLNNLLREFKTLDSTIDQRLKNGEYKSVELELNVLQKNITKNNSQLGRECLDFVRQINFRYDAESNARRKRLLCELMFYFFLITFGAFVVYLILKNAE
jgi:hypothetical protein